MARSLWNGTVAFGMVRVPVKLYSATEARSIGFHERHLTDGAAIEHRRVCLKEDREVPYSEIAKGFEVAAGSYVVLSKEEVASADGQAAHVIDIEHFVNRAEIDPVYYERCFYLGPGKLGDEGYRLLAAALSRSDRVGIGHFVFHNRARLVAIRSLEQLIVLHTMRFADEIVPVASVEAPNAQRQPSKQEVQMAQTLVDQLQAPFKPEGYKDSYREAVLAVIERKARGEAIQAADAEPARSDDDLLAALQASLDSHQRRQRPRRATSERSAHRRPRSPAGSRR